RAGRSGHLGALTGTELDRVHDRAGRHVAELQRVAGLDVCARAALHGRTDLEAGGREDVGLRTVGIVEQRDAGRPVRVVLDRSDLRRHPVLHALEVDLAIAALVTATLMAGR